MQINDGEIYIYKSKNFENNYYTRERKKEKNSDKYMTDSNGKQVVLYKTVYLPENHNLGDFSHIRFKGYTSLSVANDGTIKEYISVDEILEVIDNKVNDDSSFSNSDIPSIDNNDDDLPF